MKLEVKNLTKSFGEKEVLHGISFDVEGGKALGLLGRNGAGKTTTIRIIMDVFHANSGFYNGLTFHRVIDGFMIQGGDPNGDGTGGSSEKIKGEFKSNGVQNNISHIRGTISMARSSANNSASSQFFIMQKDTPSLDGQYAAFGTVTSGMDIVDKISKDCTDTNQNGVITDKSKQPVISTIRVVD